MNVKYSIGMDIGGTNTDAVLVNERQEIVMKHKTPTTAKPEEGVEIAIQSLLTQTNAINNEVGGLFIGTTHATNSILECQNLFRVGVIRLAGQKSNTLDSCAFWPKKLTQAIFVGSVTIDGGFQCDGREITSFDRQQAKSAAQQLLEKGAEAIAIAGVFSPIFRTHEIECAEALHELLGKDFPISLSYQIGGVGFIERENGAILNCALMKSIRLSFDQLEKVKIRCGLSCPLWITQNDGSVIDIKQAIDFPLLTISSGPTNSFVGASKLSGLSDALIVDIGGTSTDIGMIKNGYPKRSMHNVNIGGVNLNFRMPDVLALAIGGGSYIVRQGEGILVGPESCGKQLLKEAQVFGGEKLTLTDVAVAAGYMEICGGRSPLISSSDAQQVIALVIAKIQEGIRCMQGNQKDLPIVVVGGGAPCMQGTPRAYFPKNFDVANGYGSALAEISGTVDTVLSLVDREASLNRLKEEAVQMAVKKGADSKSTSIVDLTIMPYHYMPGQLARVVVKASGKRRSR